MRILALDFGQKNIGVAISDPFGWSAQGLETIRRKQETDIKESVQKIANLVEQYQVQKIVIGFPKNMNNTCGERAEKTLLFKSKLEKSFSIPIILWDERLSSAGAERILLEADVNRKKRKTLIDKMAAVFILQGYLDSISK